jgi:hypothetical protein
VITLHFTYSLDFRSHNIQVHDRPFLSVKSHLCFF